MARVNIGQDTEKGIKGSGPEVDKGKSKPGKE